VSKHNKNVILSMPDPVNWTFMSYVTDRGEDVIETWDVDRSFEAERSFWAMIKNCRKVSDFLQWPSFRHRMRHEAGKAGVCELEFKADKKPYRVLCKFTGNKCVILLCVCYHKGSSWTPSNSVKVATNRARAIEEGKAKTNVIATTDSI
jgi:Phage derived protein Gp49-like (DUF891)